MTREPAGIFLRVREEGTGIRYAFLRDLSGKVGRVGDRAAHTADEKVATILMPSRGGGTGIEGDPRGKADGTCAILGVWKENPRD